MLPYVQHPKSTTDDIIAKQLRHHLIRYLLFSTQICSRLSKYQTHPRSHWGSFKLYRVLSYSWQWYITRTLPSRNSLANERIDYNKTGDFVRGKNLAILGELLDRGVKVALMYGDRDYQCNCT